MSEMRPYIVRQGEYLKNIAWRHGIPKDNIWYQPKNESLRAERPDPNLLNPGDVMFVLPPKRNARVVRLGSENQYLTVVVRVSVKVELHDAKGTPYAVLPFVVEGVTESIRGSTDGAGVVKFEAPIDCESVILRLPTLQRVLRVDIGHLDPVSEESGVRTRLEHLGYLRPSAEASALTDAVRVFQGERGLEVTGDLDDDTRAALVKTHGG